MPSDYYDLAQQIAIYSQTPWDAWVTTQWILHSYVITRHGTYEWCFR